ncbi:MAG: hypothetical protein R3D59_09350 [Paracoccaceae bacterium]
MRLSPSLFAADPLAWGGAPDAVGPHADSWHFDVMDGRFAPAHGLNEAQFLAVKASSAHPIEVHLMTETPGDWPLRYARMGAALVAVHGETIDAPADLLNALRNAGARAFLA